jgi:small-conductance mechanosensitive channel
MTKSPPFQAPLLSIETIQERLETGAHGSRASLTKCATRYRTFLETIHADDADADAIEQSKQELEQELQLYQVEVHKMSLSLETTQEELTQLESVGQETSTLIRQRQQQLVALRSKQSRSKQVWGYKEEYEALAKMGNHRPSRAILEKRLLLTEKQTQLAIAAEQATKNQVELREKQFQLLMQCMLDIKASVNEEINSQDDNEEEDDEGLVSMDTTL